MRIRVSELLYALVGVSLAALGFARHGLTLDAVLFTFGGWILIAFLLVDLRKWIIPKKFAQLAVMLAVLFSVIGHHPGLKESVLGIIFGFFILESVSILSTWLLRRTFLLELDEFAIGSGDALLLAVIGGLLGYFYLVPVLFLASVQGLLAYVLAKGLRLSAFFEAAPSQYRNAVPFGAFLCVAAIELMIWPNFLYR